MGVDYNTYIGPYIRCENPEVEKVLERRACGNKDCANFGDRYKVKSDQKFCPECGSEVRDDVEVAEVWPRVSSWDVSESMNERWYQPGTNYDRYPFEDGFDIWIPNRSIKGLVSHHLDARRDCGAFDYEDLKPDDQISLLQDRCKKDLKAFEKHYGAVSVHWGVLSYAS